MSRDSVSVVSGAGQEDEGDDFVPDDLDAASGGGRKHREDGWLWDIGRLSKVSEEDFAAWQEEGGGHQLICRSTLSMILEGNRVQWFRAEADMFRWLEQLEMKMVDFARCHTTFHRMAEVWETLATEKQSLVGFSGFAHRQSSLFKGLKLDLERKFKVALQSIRNNGLAIWDVEDLASLADFTVVRQHVAKFRSQQLKWMLDAGLNFKDDRLVCWFI